jgi:hypothetical protein
VTVANIQIENLKIEAEKGFRRTLFEPESVDPNVEINFVNDSKVRLWEQQGDANFVSSIRRKGNSSNHIIHAVKESRVTYDAGLTIFASDWRVLFSPLMETLKFSPCILSAEAKD